MRDYYFSIVGVFLLVLTLIGFSDNLFTDVRQESNFDPKFIVHGIFCLAWMIIFAIQTNLIRTYNYRIHQTLGIAAVVVAFGVLASTLYLFFVIWNGWDNLVFYARPNRFFLPSFGILVGLGYYYRRTPVLHKRLMFLATLLMMGPVLDRLPYPMNPMIAVAIMWNVLFVSLFVFDWKTLGRFHPITYFGFIWFYFVWAIAVFT